MTTRDPPTDSPKPAEPDPPRATRPEPPRTGPLRGARDIHAGQAGGSGPHGGAGDGGGFSGGISEDMAQTVRVSYDVFTKNLEIGRRAASQFSQGQYPLGRAPRDLGHVALEILRLLNQLSNATFDILERLVRELENAPQPQPAPVPPFHPFTSAAAPPRSRPQSHPPEGLPLTVRFASPTIGKALAASLARPQASTAPGDIKAAPLQPRDGAAAPITEVAFEYDVASGGLTATVTARAGQAAGVYSGIVWAATQDTPLGVLSVEIVE